MHKPRLPGQNGVAPRILLALSLVVPAVPGQAQTNPFEDFKRKVAVCQGSEEWLRDTCLAALYTSVSEGSGVEGTVNPIARTVSSAEDGQRAGVSEQTPHKKGDTGDQDKTMLAAFTEMHIVGINEAVSGRDKPKDITKSPVSVYVHRPGQRVALVLTSREPVLWDVQASPQTSIVRVVVGGEKAEDKSEATRVLLDGVDHAAERIDVYAAHQPEGNRFHPYYTTIRKHLGADRAASFSSAYTAPVDGFVVATGQGVPTEEEEQKELKARAVAREHLSPRFAQAIERYEAEQNKPQPRAQNESITFGERGFTHTVEGKPTVYGPLPADMPEASHVVGTSYDPHNQKLFAVTLGGEGFLYIYDIPTKVWTAGSMDNVDVGGIHYDEQTESLYLTPGWEAMGKKAMFQRLDGNGKVQATYPFDLTDFPGLDRLYDPGNGPEPVFAPIAVEDGVLLVRAYKRHSGNRNTTNGPSYYLVLLETGRTMMVW